MKKIRLSRKTIRNFIGSALIIACFSAAGFFFRERLFGEDYHIIDYDFYVGKGTLYAFVIEGKGEENYNKISGKRYFSGNRLMVFKKAHKPDEALKKYMVDKETRREYFAPEGSIDSLLRSMRLAYEKDFGKVHPWTITVGQLDRDEAIEFFVGAYRPTSFYSNNTRPYFLEYKDAVFVRQWTGSYLDHLCFTEAAFVDPEMDGINVLRLEEYVMKKGRVEAETGEFTIYGFQPIRLSPKKTADR